ncbi:MAG: SRPBCC family protein [Solirubrobacterales bacterium]|nr:SRPBCC family protein [Solirubrobacterales bacterium]
MRLTRESAATHTAEPDEEPVHVKAAITVRRDRDECYAYWRDFERFPSFMAHIEEVTATSPTRSHWQARGALGMKPEWDAEMTADVPGERISWRSIEGSKIDNSGTVRFVAAPGDQGTEIHVELRYAPPAGAVGATIAKLFGEEPAVSVKDDLRRFKQIVETGEVARSDGSPEGQLGRRQLKPRPANPLSDSDLQSTKVGGAS